MVKTITWVFISLLILALLAGAVFYVFKPRSAYYGEIKLTEDKLITNQTLINLIVFNMTSPLGNSLEKIVSDEDDPQIIDDSWKISYFSCTENEHFGWVYYSTGDSEPKLYGPYGWCYI